MMVGPVFLLLGLGPNEALAYEAQITVAVDGMRLDQTLTFGEQGTVGTMTLETRRGRVGLRTEVEPLSRDEARELSEVDRGFTFTIVRIDGDEEVLVSKPTMIFPVDNPRAEMLSGTWLDPREAEAEDTDTDSFRGVRLVISE